MWQSIAAILFSSRKSFGKMKKANGVGVPTCGHNVESFWPLKAARCRVGPKLLEKTTTAGISSFSQNKMTSKAETENVVFVHRKFRKRQSLTANFI